MNPIIQKLSTRRELIILALMLEALHFSLWIDFGSPLSRSFMLIHLGLFLLWQPVWRSDERLSWQNSLLFIILTLVFVKFITWWLMFGWLILLSGFAGGRVLINRQERNTYMIVLLFLTSELVIECTTGLFNIAVSGSVRDLFRISLPVLPVFITLFPISSEGASMQSVDILHALTTSTLISALIFGSLLNMYLGGIEYLISLIQTLLAIALFLFAISWLLSPRLGFSGLSQLWTRSLLNIGTPFERWLTNLSELARQQQTPSEFLEAAFDELVSLPWIAGVKWQTRDLNGECGNLVKTGAEFRTNELTVNIYSNNWIGGALYLHCTLLVQLIENFYVAKIHERKLMQQAQMHAIYETGARVTHDIKNILQSFQVITSFITQDKDENANRKIAQGLLEKQFPHLTQRLQLALTKLQLPQNRSREKIYLKEWWGDVRSRNSRTNIVFHSDMTGNPLIPSDLFDSVVENLLENIRVKMQSEAGLSITLSLHSDANTVHLSVSDNGSKIPEKMACVLLKEPVNSSSGLGIGLFQAARQAESMGYSLALKSNRDGNVCFELSRQLA
ncbi:MAG: sensor histidine kinase [Gammaproteobacteria bacterium]